MKFSHDLQHLTRLKTLTMYSARHGAKVCGFLLALALCICWSPALSYAAGGASLCPANAKPYGKAPPKGDKIVCRKPSQKRKGLFLKHGRIMEWHSNGALKLEGEYWNNMKHGQWTEYHNNGQPSLSASYKRGTKVGKWMEWHRNGQLLTQVEYVDGRKHGREVNYYSSGLKKSEGDYQNGREHGKWVIWNRDGSFKEKLFYDSGRVVQKDDSFE